MTDYPHLHERILELTLQAEQAELIDCCLRDGDRYLLSIDARIHQLTPVAAGVILLTLLKNNQKQ